MARLSRILTIPPYLEDPHLWPSVHHRLISTISDMLTAQVAPHFYVTIEERGDRDTLDEDDAPIVPNVYLVQQPSSLIGTPTSPHAPTAPTFAQVLEPLEVRDRYIEVRDRADREVVTTIEVLSPRNKAPNTKGRRAFLAKRRAVLGAAANWIEIDLLRGGHRPDEVAHQSDYYALLKRRGHADQLNVWFIDLRDQLPVIAVPLRSHFPDALLDLGAALTNAYTRGRYDLRLDYRQSPPLPLLRKADATWAAACVRTSRAVPELGDKPAGSGI